MEETAFVHLLQHQHPIHSHVADPAPLQHHLGLLHNLAHLPHPRALPSFSLSIRSAVAASSLRVAATSTTLFAMFPRMPCWCTSLVLHYPPPRQPPTPHPTPLAMQPSPQSGLAGSHQSCQTQFLQFSVDLKK